MDAVMDNAAQFLGDRWHHLGEFYNGIKTMLNRPGRRSFGVTPATVSDICYWGSQLHRAGLLAHYEYQKPNRRVWVEPQREGPAINFFTGEWLERYVCRKVEQALRAAGQAGEALPMRLGAKISLPDESAGELDLLVGLPSDGVLWMECKTGTWQNHVSRLKLRAEQLNLPVEDCALLLVDGLSDDERACAGGICRMTVIGLPDLTDWLTERLAAHSAIDGPVDRHAVCSDGESSMPPAERVDA